MQISLEYETHVRLLRYSVTKAVVKVDYGESYIRTLRAFSSASRGSRASAVRMYVCKARRY